MGNDATASGLFAAPFEQLDVETWSTRTLVTSTGCDAEAAVLRMLNETARKEVGNRARASYILDMGGEGKDFGRIRRSATVLCNTCSLQCFGKCGSKSLATVLILISLGKFCDLK